MSSSALRLASVSVWVAAVGMLLGCSATAADGAGQRPAPAASAGCGRAPPPAPPDAVEVGGRRRELIAVLPEGYRPDRPHRLVIAFHGRTNSNAQVRRYYDLERHAAEPTLFVYPAGVPDGEGRFTWWPPGEGGPETVFDAVVEAFADRYCLALDRIDVVGHSLGASAANEVACRRGEAVRALGSLGGGMPAPARDCRGAVAAIVLHNPEDRQVPVAQGRAARDAFLAQSGIAEEASAVPVGPEGFHCERYGPPGAGTPVLWCPHTFDVTGQGRYYPHQWPSGTGALIMAFFDSLPEPARRTRPAGWP